MPGWAPLALPLVQASSLPLLSPLCPRWAPHSRLWAALLEWEALQDSWLGAHFPPQEPALALAAPHSGVLAPWLCCSSASAIGLPPNSS
jgi:hypothetical protein